MHLSLKLAGRLAAAALLLAAVGCGGGGPEATVDGIFGCLAKGDLECQKQYVAPGQRGMLDQAGPRQVAIMKAMGDAYQGVEKVEVEGDQAVAFIKMDVNQLEEAFVAEMTKTMGDSPQAKQMLEGVARGMAKEMAVLPVHLRKMDGQWYASGGMGPQ